MKECDIQKVDRVNELLQTAPEARDQTWREKFFDTAIDASFRCQGPQVIQGPDGFPYTALYSPVPHEPFESYCICNLIEFLLDNGFGVVINPGPTGADWVFSYGDILTYQMFGKFELEVIPLEKTPFEEIKIEKKEEVLIGQPSEEFLPVVARKAIQRHFEDVYSREGMGVFLMSRQGFDPPTQLVFSVFPDEFEQMEQFQAALKEISWFLPRHYPVLAIPQDSTLSESFKPL